MKQTGRIKAFKLLRSRGSAGISSVDLSAMFDGRTMTARLNELVDEGVATAETVTIQGVRRAIYKLKQPLQGNTEAPAKTKKYTYKKNENGEYVAIPIYV